MGGLFESYTSKNKRNDGKMNNDLKMYFLWNNGDVPAMLVHWNV